MLTLESRIPRFNQPSFLFQSLDIIQIVRNLGAQALGRLVILRLAVQIIRLAQLAGQLILLGCLGIFTLGLIDTGSAEMVARLQQDFGFQQRQTGFLEILARFAQFPLAASQQPGCLIILPLLVQQQGFARLLQLRFVKRACLRILTGQRQDPRRGFPLAALQVFLVTARGLAGRSNMHSSHRPMGITAKKQAICSQQPAARRFIGGTQAGHPGEFAILGFVSQQTPVIAAHKQQPILQQQTAARAGARGQVHFPAQAPILLRIQRQQLVMPRFARRGGAAHTYIQKARTSAQAGIETLVAGAPQRLAAGQLQGLQVMIAFDKENLLRIGCRRLGEGGFLRVFPAKSAVRLVIGAQADFAAQGIAVAQQHIIAG